MRGIERVSMCVYEREIVIEKVRESVRGSNKVRERKSEGESKRENKEGERKR